MSFSAFCDALRPAGLNLVAVADVAAWDTLVPESRRSAALAPGARRIVVVANGGRTMWEAFLADLAAHPAHLADEAHPLDAFAWRAIQAAPVLPGARRWFRAAAEETTHLDFRLLAGLAGLGHQSRLGLLIHPVYGPWLGLRAACFVDADLPLTPLTTPNPCDPCPAPCASTCPGSAFPDGRWSVDVCSAFHTTSTRCASDCAARGACPEGAAHRYADDQVHYHYNRLAGRAWLRARVGLDGDPHEGDGPHWGTWRQRVDVGRR